MATTRVPLQGFTSPHDITQEIIKDISIIQSINSNNSARLQAQKRLDALKTEQRAQEMKMVGLEIFGSIQLDLFVRFYAILEPRHLDPHRALALLQHKDSGHVLLLIYLNRHSDAKIFVRFFGLQILGSCIAYGHFAPQDMLLLLNSVREDDQVFVKEKICCLFVELVKRIWPGNWSIMDLILRSLYSENVSGLDDSHRGFANLLHIPGGSSLGVELVCKIYKRLIEDVFIFDDPIALKRKQELSTSLLATCVDAQSLNRWIEKERSCEESYKTKTDLDRLLQLIRADPNNIGWMSRITEGLKNEIQMQKKSGILLHLDTLESFLNWIPVSSINESGIQYILLELLLSPLDYAKEPAMDCLLTLVGRNFRPLDSDTRHEIFWKPLFSQSYLARIIQFWSLLHSSQQSNFSSASLVTAQANHVPTSEDVHRLAKKIAQFVSIVGSSHINYKKNTGSVPEHFDQYFEFLLILSTHPSAYVSGWGLDCIFDSIRHEYIKTILLVDSVAITILEYMTRYLGRPSVSNQVHASYFMLDFDQSKKEEALALAHINLRRSEIVKILAATPTLTHPVYNWIDGQVRLLFTSQTVEYSIMQLSLCLEVVLGAIPQSLIKDESTRNMNLYNSTSSLLEGILSLDIQDVNVVAHQLPMLASFSPFMDAYPTLLFRCMERFFALVSFTQPQEGNGNVENVILSDETILVRRKATGALVKLGSSMPDVFIPIIDQIAPAIVTLASSGRLLKTESRILLEFLINVISGSTLLPLSKKSEYLAAVLENEFQCLDAFIKPLSTAEDFYRILIPYPLESWISITDSPSTDFLLQFEQLDRWRRDFANQLLSFRHWLKRSHESAKKSHVDISTLWQPYIPKILSLVLSLISHIHSLWDPETWNRLPGKIKKITTLTPFEKVMAMGGDAEGVKGLNQSESENPLNEQIFKLWSWLGRSRDACYQLCNTLSLFPVEFYESGAVPQSFMNALFSHAKYISLHHWKSLLQTTMIPFTLHCPNHLYASVLRPILPALTKYLNEQLTLSWTPENMAKMSVQGAQEDSEAINQDDFEIQDLSDEVVFEKVLRTFTRSYADLWGSIFSVSKTTGTSAILNSSASANCFRYPELAQFCMTHPELIPQWTAALVLLLKVKDTSACLQALKICSALVTPLSSNPTALSFLGNDLLLAVLEVISDGYQKSNHTEAIHLIIEIYCTLRPLCEIPFYTLAQLPGMEKGKLEQFERELLTETNAKSRTGITKSFFASFHGLEVSEWGRERVLDFANQQEKQLFAKTEKQVGRANLLDEDVHYSVLGDLFEK